MSPLTPTCLIFLELILAAIMRVAFSDPKSKFIAGFAIAAAFKSTGTTFCASAMVDEAAAKGVRTKTVKPCFQFDVFTPDCQLSGSET